MTPTAATAGHAANRPLAQQLGPELVLQLASALASDLAPAFNTPSFQQLACRLTPGLNISLHRPLNATLVRALISVIDPMIGYSMTEGVTPSTRCGMPWLLEPLPVVAPAATVPRPVKPANPGHFPYFLTAAGGGGIVGACHG